MPYKNNFLNHAVPTQALAKVIGNDKIRTDEKSRFEASYDNLRISLMPDAVIFPASEADVAFTLQIANQHSVPVTVRGAGSGCAGAVLPMRRGWVMNLSHWKEVEIDPDNNTAIAQPGATIREIDDAAEKYGLFFPPNPSSMDFATIGGNIATNASGPRTAKYGTCRDYVYSLEGFLPSGKFVSWGRLLRRYTSVYDIKDLWVGSQGTLGIITKAFLKLIPRPEERRVFMMGFNSREVAVDAALQLHTQGYVPAGFEFSDDWVIDFVRTHHGGGKHYDILNMKGLSLVFVEIDGTRESNEEHSKIIREWAAKHAVITKETFTESERDTLWKFYASRPRTSFIGNKQVQSEEVVIPRKELVSFVRFFQELKKETGLDMGMSSDITDGVCCVNFIFDHDDAKQQKSVEQTLEKIIAKSVELGGSISGKFGVGISKSPYLGLQHSEAEIEAMLAIRKAIDPNSILAPGQIFMPTRMWNYKVTRIHMPWD